MRLLIIFLIGVSLLSIKHAEAQAINPRLSASEIQSFLPQTRSAFTFPSPYNTKGIRLTIPSDCNNADCVQYVGYSYWRNINNHVGTNILYAFITLRNNGGPTLFSYNKNTDVVTKVGPLFPLTNPFSSSTGEGWYFSAKVPHDLYIYRSVDTKFYRYDIITKNLETVLDIATRQDLFASNKYLWQMHSSDDDLVHAGTIRNNGDSRMLGCFVYNESTGRYSYYPTRGNLDECNLDASGRWLIILEDNDNRVIDLNTGTEETLRDEDGALGHLDMGYGYAVGADNYNPRINATVVLKFPLKENNPRVVHSNPDWNTAEANHVSHQNRKPGVPESQYACGSNLDSVSGRENEIVCFPLDGSGKEMAIAPVMGSISASGGRDSYSKAPKANLDITGEYVIWTTNTLGNRLDAYIAKVPKEKITGDTSSSIIRDLQEQINRLKEMIRLLIEAISRGQIVVRL